VRWAASLLPGLPLFLLVLAGAAATAGHSEASRKLLRGLRYLLAAELAFVIVIACIGAVYQAMSANRERRLYRPPGKLIDIGGYRLHLYGSGDGSPTVVLDYGLDGSYLDWYHVQPEVARFARICAYDRGGYGWSDPSPKPRIPSVMVEELHTLLSNAGEKPPYILVGHSYGSFNVLMFAHKYREEVAGIVLVDGVHPDAVLPFSWRNKLWQRIMQLTMPFGLPRWRGWCGEGSADIAPIKKAVECRSRVYRTYYAQWAAFPESATEVRNLGPLGDLPLVVISRDPKRKPDNPNDPLFSKKEQRWQNMQRRLAEFSTNSTQVTARDSGHSVPQQRPDVVIEGIRKVVEAARKNK
jgi:pimeloyl-ACP methyl ester carboxylesterase